MSTSLASVVGKVINTSKDKTPADQLIIVAKDDNNLVHDYFFACDHFWDARSCYSQIVLGFPKDKHDKIDYWIKYQNKLIYVYMGIDFSKETVRNNIFFDIKQAHKPFFIGRVSNVIEETDQISVTVSNIGERFKVQIPDDFRQQYIYNQNVRDTFQAICELLGVKYICPPQTSSLNEPTNPDGDVNNPASKTQQEQNTSQDIANQAAANQENGGNEDGQNGTNTDEQNNNTAQTAVQQGYGQINFDANGAITFNNAVIEQSPDSEKSLIAITDETYKSFLKEGEEVLKDVTKFLNGEAFEETHPFYLDYNAITIEPKSASTTTPETLNDPTQDTGTPNAGTETGGTGTSSQGGSGGGGAAF